MNTSNHELLASQTGLTRQCRLTKLHHFTVLRTWFGRIPMKTWCAFLSRSAEKRTGYSAIDATGFDSDQPSGHYANCTSYRIRALKVTALVDVETLYITDIHCTTTKKHDAKIGPRVGCIPAGDLRSLAADRGYDLNAFTDELRGNSVRPLIKHRIYSSLNHAHNARMDSDRYHQRSMSETVFSSIKRTLGSAVRARSWNLEFREMVLKATVYNLRWSVRYP